MLFSLDKDDKGLESQLTHHDGLSNQDLEDTLEHALEEEGLEYFGGFIAHKFPQYEYLGFQVLITIESD